jgi:hypothetical protein
MAKKLISQAAMDRLSSLRASPARFLVVRWSKSTSPTRARITEVFTAIMANEFCISLNRGKLYYTIRFIDLEDLKITQTCSSFYEDSNGIFHVEMSDLNALDL